MSKTDQVLVLEPSNELRFRGPFTDVVTADLKLTNPVGKRVCFKVKTTAPRKYCVRPNSGIIEPGATVSVAVMLQPFEYDPQEKNKHKFMVQTMFAPEGKIDSQDALWKDVAPENVMDSKLKCVFELPDSSLPGEHTVVQEKIKEERVKTQNKEPPTPPRVGVNTTPETDSKKMIEEMKRIKEENESLKKEINELRNEGARLRKVAMSQTVSSTPSPVQSTPNKALLDLPVTNMPVYLYVIIALILGFLVGEFLI
ncbi:hypothetical protein CHS0354_021898 [Potamilus streckersoni]|uniref:MSP domain-containing protein n=1 Tax=Potamilus streckersoni TaxID=2493646 RepID=A0AAE0TJJ7_9BIVA|nr:hypothetical protein CHS0354_021898 [Potamilus streckersoni]